MLSKFKQTWRNRSETSLVAIRADLIDACQHIAAEENISVAHMINELLSFAVEKRLSSNQQLALWLQLTQREQEIAVLVSRGLTNPQIGRQLSISSNTVKTHIKNILTKFNVNSKEALRENLSLLDFSAWENTAGSPQLTPISTASPHEVTP